MHSVTVSTCGDFCEGLALPFSFYAGVVSNSVARTKDIHFMNSNYGSVSLKLVLPRVRSGEHAHEHCDMFQDPSKCLIHSLVKDEHSHRQCTAL